MSPSRSFVAATLLVESVAAAPGPPPEGYTLAEVTPAISPGAIEGVTQLAFAPDDPSHVFVARSYESVVTRYDYAMDTGELSSPVDVATGLVYPVGLAFHGAHLLVTENEGGNAGITRLRDVDEDGVFETKDRFVTGIPRGNHHVNQLRIVGNTLFTSIGMASNSGHPDCENAYTGVVAWIQDLTRADYAAENLAPEPEFPIGDTNDGKLRLYAYGFRNAYGICTSAGDELWVADNGARACASCCAGNELPADTPDLLFRDVRPGDEGAFPPPGAPGAPDAPIAPFAVFPEHWATTGLDFVAQGPDAGDALVAIYGPTIETKPGGRNVVRVDAVTGEWEVFIDGFDRPIDVVRDPFGRLLIADRGAGEVYLLTLDPETPVLPPAGETAPAVPALQVRATPNPFDASARITIALPAASDVSVAIFDPSGRRVYAMKAAALGAGEHVVRWPPRGDRPAATGVYLARVQTAHETRTIRLTKLR